MAAAADNRRTVRARVPRAPGRIGALPDDVLRRIMSQLSSREAVHTCLLARRWRHLWREVPIINATFEDFEDSAAGQDTFEREAMFKKFVTRFLLLRNRVGLDEFRLDYSLACGTEDLGAGSADANLWISNALRWNALAVKVLSREHQLELDPSVFTSSFLRRLHISSARLVPGFFHQLQLGCPALEYLFLSDCLIMDHEIFSSTVKVLILAEEVMFSCDHDDPVSISAASAISVSIECDLSVARLPTLKNMESLETASVLLCGHVRACDAAGIRQFLGGLSHVTSLDFRYMDGKLTMEKNIRWCPTFSNLINLTVDTSCVHADFYALIVFLQSSPCLKNLTLKLDQACVYVISGELEDRSFTCEQLEIVEIICSETDELLPGVTQFLRASGIGTDQMRITHKN